MEFGFDFGIFEIREYIIFINKMDPDIVDSWKLMDLYEDILWDDI
jgi:hypothetical protein